MIPTFIIHARSCVDRHEIVKDITKKAYEATKMRPIVVDAILESDGVAGNRKSHIAVARLAKGLFPDKPYLVFEDDCELFDNWYEPIKEYDFCDLIYIGTNGRCEHTVFGTHALYVRPSVRDLIIEQAEKEVDTVQRRGAFDHILTKLYKENFKTACVPKDEFKEYYCRQKKGLRSMITGQPRV